MNTAAAETMSRQQVKVKPEALKKLVDKVGIKAASEQIGQSAPSISKHLKEGSCAKSIELAARHLIAENASPASRQRLLILKADLGPKLDMVKSILEASGIKYREFTD